MTSVSGARFGDFQVVSVLGAGGMGEVYRAKDTKLGRDVALKILPASFTNDSERVARFRREAQVLASLNHPHIAQIYGLEEVNGTQFLVLELVDGESLDRRIARGPIPVDEALGLARQIAEALEAAHEKGIIHRDLKPANIALTKDGQVKVLDFGLAKAVETTSGSFDAMNSPTITSPAMMTGVGVILGTAAYMAPEQARGRAIDKRADIWAFGCVVYEMLSGKPPFTGETVTDIVAAVVKNDPDWTLLLPTTPPHVVSTLERCLVKDPGERWHDIADVRMTICRPPVVVGAPSLGAEPTSAASRAVVPIVAATLAVLATVAVSRFLMKGSSEAGTVTRLQLNLPVGVELYTGNAPAMAFAPDGRHLAFIGIIGGERRIYIRSLDRYDATALKGTEQAQALAFSPDGSSLAFMNADRSLKRISLSDGLVNVIAHNGDPFDGVAWSVDGLLVYNVDGHLVEVPSSGGQVVRSTTLDASRGELVHLWPAPLPHRRGLLFSAIRTDDNPPSEVDALSTSISQRRVVAGGLLPMYVPSGYLVFCRERDLIAAPFDDQSLQVTGEAVRVVEDVGVDPSGAPLASVSATGTLIYAPGQTGSSHVVWVSRDGAEQAVTDSVRRYRSPRLAPDGKTIALHAGGNLWLHDLERNTSARLTSETTIGSGNSQWSHDGKHLAFRSRRGMRWVDVERGTSQSIGDSKSVGDVPNSVSPDDTVLLFSRQSPDSSSDIFAVSLIDGGAPRPIVKTGAFEGGAQFSPDGRWIAYASNESGHFEVYLRAYGGVERRWPVSNGGGSFPLWRRDGHELFYRNGDKMMAVDVVLGRDTPALSAPRLLFDQQYTFETSTIANYDVSLDGTRFLMVKDDFGGGRLNVILNWAEELKHLVPSR